MKILSSWVKAQNYKHALQGERLTLSDIWCHPMGHKIGQMGSRLWGECRLDPFVLLHILPPSLWPLLTRKRPTRHVNGQHASGAKERCATSDIRCQLLGHKIRQIGTKKLVKMLKMLWSWRTCWQNVYLCNHSDQGSQRSCILIQFAEIQLQLYLK